MDQTAEIIIAPNAFELQFHPIAPRWREMRFPCDELGHVNLDDLSESSRREYLFAHMLIGHDFTSPQVCASACTADVRAIGPGSQLA